MYALVCRPSSPSDSHQKPVAHTSSQKQLLESSRGSSTSKLKRSLVVKMKRHNSWGQQKACSATGSEPLGQALGFLFFLVPCLFGSSGIEPGASRLLGNCYTFPPALVWVSSFCWENFISTGENMYPAPPPPPSMPLSLWQSRGGQLIWSALDKPHPGKTLFITMVSPLPGKDLCAFLYSTKLISPLKSS